jgi:uncharacterized GH25 family protein
VVIGFATFAGKGCARRIALTAAVWLTAADLQAHDFWIEPSTFHPASGMTVAVALRVGQNFVGDPVARSSRLIEQFVVRQAGSEQPIAGTENIDPAGWLRADGQATAVIAYRSQATFVELPAARFEEYLRLEGLDRIIDVRTRRGEREKPGRERFARYAKALLTGERTSGAVTQPLGLAYEIVPDQDPTRRLAPFGGRVLYAGRPLEGALVVAILRSDPSVRIETRSDARGAFSFPLSRPGVWLVKSVHMVAASWFSSADWESLWASLTFEAPEAPPSADAQSSR